MNGRAWVTIAVLAAWAARAEAPAASKRVMVVVKGALTLDGKPGSFLTARSRLEEAFRGAGWQVVPSQELASDSKEAIDAAVSKQPADAVVYGTESCVVAHGDQVIMEFDPHTHQQQLFLLDCKWELELIDGTSALVVARSSGKHVVERDLVLNASYAMSADEFAKAIAATALPALTKGTLTAPAPAEQTLEVKGLAAKDAAAFAALVQKAAAVKSIVFRDPAFVIEPGGALNEVAKALEGKAFKGKKLSVVKVTATAITVQLKP
ncbi:MAG: hypothetical protein QM723_09300 [Myxococcaceae bacterium]